MNRNQISLAVATTAFAATLFFAAPASAAPADGTIGGTPLATTDLTTCPAGKPAVGVSGTLGQIGPNPIVGTITMECVNDEDSVGTMGTGSGGAPGSSLCGEEQVAVGIVGKEGDFIDQISVRCQADDLTGPISTAGIFGGAGGAADGPYQCPAGQALQGLTGTVSDDGVYVRNVVISCAILPVESTTTLTVKKDGKKLKASGSVDPNHAGVKVKVTLLRKKGGKFKAVDQKQPTLDVASEYRTSFKRPDTGKCKITAKFPGDGDSKPSSASETFSC